MKIASADYVRPMVRFLPFLRTAVREYPAAPGLKCYGTGESAHWAVQCNQQTAGALAVLAEDPDYESFQPVMSRDELRGLALSFFRYSLRTHLTGDLVCSDGKQWGRHWISVLGMERATPGLNALEPYFTDEDRERYRRFRVFESDYRLDDYPVRAGIDASKGSNVPESNIWNAGFLMRTALDYPDLPRAEAYLDKATRIMLNGLSIPADAQGGTLYRGRPLKDWHVGPNFTKNFSLDHHGYMNVGYDFICLSNLALLYFNFKERGQTVPPELFLHIEDLWKTVKHLVFPDGRLLRIGGDSRSRYNYCQCFAVSAWLLAAELFHDADAVRFEKGYLGLVEHEQAQNPDGSFYGRRLSHLRDYSEFYYLRLESDPLHALSTGAYWRRKFAILDDVPETAAPDCCEWHDDFHTAALVRSPEAVRSAVRSGTDGQTFLCVPAQRSDMAEWFHNLTGFLGLHYGIESGPAALTTFPRGFVWSRRTDITEKAPMGEGEEAYRVARKHTACAALPDGSTMLFLERAEAVKETTFTFGLRSLRLQIPNDVYNGFSRAWSGDGFSCTTRSTPGADSVINTGSTRLNVDGALSVFSLNGETLKLRSTAGQNVFLTCGLWSLYADEVCQTCVTGPVRKKPGELLYDAAFAVAAKDAREPRPCGVSDAGNIRVAVFTGFDGSEYILAANFGGEPAEYLGETIAPDGARLFRDGAPC